MSRQQNKQTYSGFLADARGLRNQGSYQEDRRPHHTESNMPPPSDIPRQDAWADRDQNHLDEHDIDDETVLIEMSPSGPPSDSAGSDDTIVNRGAAFSPAVDIFADGLTMGNMALHDRIQPLGNMSTYEWIHGRRCPGDADVKDNSSKESLKVRTGHSHVSQSTGGADDDGVVVNHPSAAYLTGAGDWAADIAAPPPGSLDDDL